MALLEARAISKVFGALRALEGVDVTVRANTFHGLIGPNGSGKSTLLKAIAGAHFADGGTVVFDGTDITTMRPADRCRCRWRLGGRCCGAGWPTRPTRSLRRGRCGRCSNGSR